MTELSQRPLTDNPFDIQDDISPCVQCGYCSAFCEVSFLSVDTPRKVIRFIKRQRLDKAVNSSFLMLCKQCQTCTVACPHGIDVAGVMRRLVRARFLNY